MPPSARVWPSVRTMPFGWTPSPRKRCKWRNMIAAYATDKGFDLIIAGKETIDHNGGQVGAMVAELLDLPYVPMASKLEVARWGRYAGA
jgi:adenine/guanine phosphoribosyltransferase-like PRPP-binding protein